MHVYLCQQVNYKKKLILYDLKMLCSVGVDEKAVLPDVAIGTKQYCDVYVKVPV
jgi:hypothetical protein